MLDDLKKRISKFDAFCSSATEINKSIKELTDSFMNLVASSDVAVMHIRNYVYENYSEDITLKQLAEKFNFDYGGLSRRFQKVTGMSFPNFLNEIRLNEAMRIIKTTDHKISAVAQMVGYNNYESFSRNFKKKFNKDSRFCLMALLLYGLAEIEIEFHINSKASGSLIARRFIFVIYLF